MCLLSPPPAAAWPDGGRVGSRAPWGPPGRGDSPSPASGSLDTEGGEPPEHFLCVWSPTAPGLAGCACGVGWEGARGPLELCGGRARREEPLRQRLLLSGRPRAPEPLHAALGRRHSRDLSQAPGSCGAMAPPCGDSVACAEQGFQTSNPEQRQGTACVCCTGQGLVGGGDGWSTGQPLPLPWDQPLFLEVKRWGGTTTQGLGETAWGHEVGGRGPGWPSRSAPVEPGVRTGLWDAALGLAEGQRGAPVPPTPAPGALQVRGAAGTPSAGLEQVAGAGGSAAATLPEGRARGQAPPRATPLGPPSLPRLPRPSWR